MEQISKELIIPLIDREKMLDEDVWKDGIKTTIPKIIGMDASDIGIYANRIKLDCEPCDWSTVAIKEGVDSKGVLALHRSTKDIVGIKPYELVFIREDGETWGYANYTDGSRKPGLLSKNARFELVTPPDAYVPEKVENGVTLTNGDKEVGFVEGVTIEEVEKVVGKLMADVAGNATTEKYMWEYAKETGSDSIVGLESCTDFNVWMSCRRIVDAAKELIPTIRESPTVAKMETVQESPEVDYASWVGRKAKIIGDTKIDPRNDLHHEIEIGTIVTLTNLCPKDNVPDFFETEVEGVDIWACDLELVPMRLMNQFEMLMWCQSNLSEIVMYDLEDKYGVIHTCVILAAGFLFYSDSSPDKMKFSNPKVLPNWTSSDGDPSKSNKWEVLQVEGE